ncbi:MAG: dienelactone hydrolase family protein [Chitinophagaceae bacterium]|nr:dienelactone hydrolase family protein [Chitinophagaceae bacterium]
MKFLYLSVVAAGIIFSACNSGPEDGETAADSTAVKMDSAMAISVKTDSVNVAADTTTMKCFIAYDENKSGSRPIVLIVPEWWGVTDFTKSKAKQIAELGYFAVVVDIYGNGKIADDPKTAGSAAGPFYTNKKLATGRIQAALDKAKTYTQADSSKTAAIGFCFGGTMVLNAATLGTDFDGVVSFHGGLQGVTPSKDVKAKILVCHGAADPFVPAKDVEAFRKQFDAAKVPYTFREYPGAVHAFTNPGADEYGKKFNIPVAYNADADRNSWNDMKNFFAGIWP